MINSETYFTAVLKNLTEEERIDFLDRYASKVSAASYSHAIDDRDHLLSTLAYAEAALGDIGDADREPGDDLKWCEERAASALPRIRKMLLAYGKQTTSLSGRD
jgi:hypothetical protein